MPKLDEVKCRDFCELICEQKAREILVSVEELIKQVVDGNPAMADSLRFKIATGLLEGSQYRILPDNGPVIFEMAPAVLPDGQKIDPW